MIQRDTDQVKDISEELNLSETIEFLYHQQSISEETRITMHLLRYLRNEAIHAEVPGMLSQDSRTVFYKTENITDQYLDDLREGRKPLPPREYFITFPFRGRQNKYMIDQIKLEIELDGMENYKMRLPAVSLRLLLLCLDKLAPAFAPR